MRRCFRYQCDNVCTRREGMITFVNLCSYRLVFSKNLMKIGGLRVPLFFYWKGRRSTQKMSQINLLFLFSRTGMDALGRKNAGQKKARTSRANFMSELIYTLNILPSCLNSSSLSPASSWRISISSSMELLSAHSLSISNSRRLICSLPFHLLP